MQSRKREILFQHDGIALKFGRRIGSIIAKTPVKVQSNWINLNLYIIWSYWFMYCINQYDSLTIEQPSFVSVRASGVPWVLWVQSAFTKSSQKTFNLVTHEQETLICYTNQWMPHPMIHECIPRLIWMNSSCVAVGIFQRTKSTAWLLKICWHKRLGASLTNMV